MYVLDLLVSFKDCGFFLVPQKLGGGAGLLKKNPTATHILSGLKLLTIAMCCFPPNPNKAYVGKKYIILSLVINP